MNCMAVAANPSIYRMVGCTSAGPAGPKPWELIPKISCPMLVAWGDSDPFTPLDGPVGQFFVKQAVDRPNTEVSLLKNGNEMFIKLCCEVLRRFCERRVLKFGGLPSLLSCR
jgi:pimeloyl-ACP methyl ester carboxylesterase